MDSAVKSFGVLEIVDRAGHVQSRTRVEHLPFRIGRALDNDLILDDPYACAHHAQISGDDDLQLIDCDSLNGSFQANEHSRRAQIALGSGLELRLGHTLLRFRGINEQIAATVPDPLARSRWLGLDRLAWAVGAMLTSMVVITSNTLIDSPQALRWGALLGSAVAPMIVLALWALSWSLVNRVVAHRFHYFGHLTIGACAVVAATLLESFSAYVGFALAGGSALGGLTTVIGAALISVVIFGHLRLISRGRARALLLPSALIGIGFLTLSLLPSAADERFTTEPKFNAALKPPFAALRAGRNSTKFYEDAVGAWDDADAEAKETQD